MKKIITAVLVAALALTCSVVAFADGFVDSPSKNPVPTVITQPDGVTVTVTGYGDVANLPEAEQTAFKEAYADIKESTDLTALVPGLSSTGVAKEDLAVSDLFNISASAALNGKVELGLNVSNFAALVQYKDGAWKVVEGATYKDGKLSFTADAAAPYAVVVSTSDTPVLGDSGIWTWAMVAVASAAVVVFCVVGYKKQLKAAK